MSARYCPHSGKVIHESATDALGALRRLNKSGGPLGNPYRCDHCDGWHQTRGQGHTPKVKAFKRRKRNYEP